jgi:hypothetical protein
MKLRPEVCDANGEKALDYATALFLIRDSVARQRELIHGRLHDGCGHHCAIGAFWAENPHVALDEDLIEEVATVNDSLGPQACAKDRWKKVNEWLRWKVRVLAQAKK